MREHPERDLAQSLFRPEDSSLVATRPAGTNSVALPCQDVELRHYASFIQRRGWKEGAGVGGRRRDLN